MIQTTLRNWRQRYPRRMIGIVAGSLCIILMIAMLLHSEESDLFATPLDRAQTTEVDTRLAEWGIRHVILDGSIRVQAAQRNDILLRLALVGLPHPHVATSDETLAKLNPLTPDAVFQAQTRAGNAGDLAVALRGIDGIADASVVLAPAVTQAFSDQPEVQASAAVRITLRPGITLTPAAIEGIRLFIAGGVPGLDHQRVTIVDDHGTALGGAVTHDEAEAARVSLQSAFDEAFGANVTIVRVHVRYAVGERREREIQRLPIGGIALKDDHSIEHLHDKQRAYERTEQHDEHGSIVRESITQSAQGRPLAMAVAVLIDAHAHLDSGHVRALAAASVGLDGNRGDTLVVEEVPFRQTSLPVRNGSPTWHSLAVVLLSVAVALAAMLKPTRLDRLAKSFLRIFHGKKFLRKHSWVDKDQCSELDALELHRLLQREPAYMAAAVLGGLSAATAAKVLEFYPVDERSAIVARMTRSIAPYLCDWKAAISSTSQGTGLENSFKRDTIMPHSPR